MKAQWTSTTPAVAQVTLGDDANGIHCWLEGLGLQSEEQLDPLAFSAEVSRLMMGNTQGECSFRAAKSHSTGDVAATYFKGEVARQGQKGNLVLTFPATVAVTLTMTGATLIGVTLVQADGVRWFLRYRFGISNIT
jgi:hypothetical protein